MCLLENKIYRPPVPLISAGFAFSRRSHKATMAKSARSLKTSAVAKAMAGQAEGAEFFVYSIFPWEGENTMNQSRHKDPLH